MAAEHYYHKKTKIPLRLGTVKAWIRSEEFEFYTSAPVFSWRKVDRGTICLAEHMQIPEAATSFLDLGCGYGVIGIVAAHFNPALNVSMIDRSDRACLLARKNVKKLFLGERAKVLKGNAYAPLVETDPETQKETHPMFDVIATNPPYSAGKIVMNKIIHTAPHFLNPGGVFQLVGRHNKGGRMYKDEMLTVFDEVTEHGKDGGFRVYAAVQ